jgi:hypothetical protein
MAANSTPGMCFSASHRKALQLAEAHLLETSSPEGGLPSRKSIQRFLRLAVYPYACVSSVMQRRSLLGKTTTSALAVHSDRIKQVKIGADCVCHSGWYSSTCSCAHGRPWVMCMVSYSNDIPWVQCDVCFTQTFLSVSNGLLCAVSQLKLLAPLVPVVGNVMIVAEHSEPPKGCGACLPRAGRARSWPKYKHNKTRVPPAAETLQR